jgi:hypothetical protein
MRAARRQRSKRSTHRVLLYLPEVPPRVGIAATILALYGVFKFTVWYPGRRRASAAR